MEIERKQISTPFVKRFFDICCSLVLIVVLLPLMTLFIIAPYIEQLLSKRARGRLLYCETRMSEGKPFKLCKIRTCVQEAYEHELKQSGFVHTANVEKDKKNFLKVGWLIKQIYLDESPQLLSVLKGDLSMVGPRPANLQNYEMMMRSGNCPKSMIRAGLTGLFQAEKGKFSKTDYELDYEYVLFCKNNPWWKILLLDSKILAKTILVVLEHKGI